MSETRDWRPSANVARLREMAALRAALRAFFHQHGYLEVDTPLLARHAVSDVNIDSFAVRTSGGEPAGFLQTSPEYAMKRLLAAGAGPIFQLGKAFRDGESGSRHNPEFTLAEWYRPGFDDRALRQEMAALFAELMPAREQRTASYAEVFDAALGIDPHRGQDAELVAVAAERGLIDAATAGRAALLDYLFAVAVQPTLNAIVFVCDYPACQAALARIRAGEPAVAERFEVFVDGIEIANGYHELVAADELRDRFARDNQLRRQRGLAEVAADQRLLDAMAYGLPPCAGVAMGVERLQMAIAGVTDIRQLLAFPADLG